MYLIDQCANFSKLNQIHTRVKVLLSIVTICVCLARNSLYTSLAVFFSMLYLTVIVGELKWRIYIRLLRIPSSFLFMSCAAMLIGNLSWQSLNSVAGLMIKSMACITCLLFLSLTTPVFEIVQFLYSIKLPMFLTELMLYMYRFIFILADSYTALTTAQKARLGNQNIKAGYRSLASLAATLFIKAYKRSEGIYTAMEARLYEGGKDILLLDKKEKTSYYLGIILFECALVVIGMR